MLPKFLIGMCLLLGFAIQEQGCDARPVNTTALDEQAKTEINQSRLNTVQPPPQISWSLERDNLIKRFKLMNDRAVMFYMYVFLEGYGPVGYYQVNKVSSVDSQLTNPSQVVWTKSPGGGAITEAILPSPAEDGSYGTNGNGVFGFTPNDIYLEHNMKYMVSTVALKFKEPAPLLTQISISDEEQLKTLMNRINQQK